MLYMINFSFCVTWLYANMFRESINKLKLNIAVPEGGGWLLIN